MALAYAFLLAPIGMFSILRSKLLIVIPLFFLIGALYVGLGKNVIWDYYNVGGRHMQSLTVES